MTRALLRLVVAAFCWLTAAYGFLASSAFAYQQFLRPHVFSIIGAFADHHAALYWFWLAVALLSLVPDFRAHGVRRSAAALFAVTWVAVGVRLILHPVLPTLGDDGDSVVVALIALAPLLWLAFIDHLAAGSFLRAQPRGSAESADRTTARLFVAAVMTAALTATLYAVFAPLAIGATFEPDLLTEGLAIGFVWNAVDHFVLFCLAFLVAALVDRTTRRLPMTARYAIVFALLSLALAAAADALFATAIGLDASAAAAGSACLSLSIVSTTAGLRLRRLAGEHARLESPFDLLFGPADARRGARALWWLPVIAVTAFALASAAARMDWDFLIEKAAVAGVWIATFAVIYRAVAATRVSAGLVALVCAAPLALHAAEGPIDARLPAWLNEPGSTVAHTLGRYVIYNPAFRLASGALRERSSSDAPTLDRFLRANTNIPASASHPIDVDLVRPLGVAPAAPPPNIFLFVIDSLRPDYLAPYNPKAAFTPAIARFANESIVFRNAFVRYGGTGLSMPTLWTGAATVHTQYLAPFHPMNALEKLLDANRYRRYISLGHIMAQILETPGRGAAGAAGGDFVELDRGVPEMAFDFCGTLAELQRDLQGDVKEPFFAHSRSLNLHVAAIRASAAPAGEAYPGFEPRYASRVHRLDACFGTFIEFLKRRGLYDRSIVILTADHGEELGEDGRWGHAYYLFPSVLRVPLLMHLPKALAGAVAVDPDAAAFLTDVTPTLYAALGYRPERATPLVGEPLIGPPGTRFSARRHSTEVVIASYGAVYGVLTRNGDRLYIIDANHRQEYAYSRRAGDWIAAPITPPFRASSQRAIREFVEEIALEYQVRR